MALIDDVKEKEREERLWEAHRFFGFWLIVLFALCGSWLIGHWLSLEWMILVVLATCVFGRWRIIRLEKS